MFRANVRGEQTMTPDNHSPERRGDGRPVQYKHPSVLRWNINNDVYQDGMNLYADGLLEIECGGHGVGMSLRRWFDLVKELEVARSELANKNSEIAKLKALISDLWEKKP